MAGKGFRYRPVDISKRYLELARQYAASQNLAVEPVHSSFEELPEKLKSHLNPRFVSLGLTYGNFNPEHILGLLKQISGEDGYVYVEAQMRDRVDMNLIREIYKGVAFDMAKGKLALVGIDINHDVSKIEVDEDIRVWATVSNPSRVLTELNIEAGDRMLLFQSLRPNKEEFETPLQNAWPNYILIDTNASFIGAVLKPERGGEQGREE